eukprot:TRINITY_DN2235_c1_g1_i1.p2 TRINITY_DN2235_c1_g1~~TRINITY_DN2235_c1_g1_i1.p2  ORF type:complete len:82 (-),score=11.57 TRINITY_DN2235_c1_g1_i1:748-993(-)
MNYNTFVFGICFSQRSNYIYYGDGDGVLKKWDVNNGNIVFDEHINSRHIWRVKLSIDGKCLFTCSLDKTVKLLDPSNFVVA